MLNIHNWRNSVSNVKAEITTAANPLRVGILGAAAINYAAIIDPAQTHPGVVIAAIAARSKAKAEAQVAKYITNPSECKAYGSYEELLADPAIDAVYIPLPNGLHCEWAIQAMQAGKHVLIEKPIANNASEARRIKDVAAETGKIALEAFHWRFHPTSIRVKNLIDSGKYGNVIGIKSQFAIPSFAFSADDIRFKYSLGGGVSMDCTYVYSVCRFYTDDTGIVKVMKAEPRICANDDKIDEAMTTEFVIEREGKPSVLCQTHADSALPPLLGFIPRLWGMMPHATIELEKARIEFPGFVLPTFSDGVVIYEKDASGRVTGNKLVEKRPASWSNGVGQTWWSTYRYQLEAFAGMIRAQEKGETWTGPNVTLDNSIDQMATIDAMYGKAGLPVRGL